MGIKANLTASAYANYRNYAVRYDMGNHSFTYWYAPRGRILKNAAIDGLHLDNNEVFMPADYKEASFYQYNNLDDVELLIKYAGGPAAIDSISLRFTLSKSGISLKTDCRGNPAIHLKGDLIWGENMQNDTFAVCMDRQGPDIRSAAGPASSSADNALFDRITDSALEIAGGKNIRIRFNWETKSYRFTSSVQGSGAASEFNVRAHQNVYEKKFGYPYSYINKNNTFSTPPAGWMTWYAVKFGANEKTVLENARWQAANLLPYGAKALWVDWEWYHNDFTGVRDDGVNVFNPDKNRYPRGLKALADDIKKLGLTPALWIGATNEPCADEFIDKDENVVLVQKPEWCGQYFFDLSHPTVRDTIIPKAFRQILEWGYEALKWDCIPTTLQLHDRYHDYMHDSEITSEYAFRQVVKAARETVGPNFYMLFCAGVTSREMLMTADVFDGMRIGGDIFTWDEFIEQCVKRVMKFYALHNVSLYNDPDNVVLRPEFNTYDQALSRICFVSLLGLPITFGDNLPELPADRVELLRRSLPAIDAHPMDVRDTVYAQKVILTNLCINRPFEEWNVAGIMNLSAESANIRLDLTGDLHLDKAEYLIYDYWNKSFLGVFDAAVPVELRPGAACVLGIRKRLGRPQILSTSRHITQGLVDLTNTCWDEANGVFMGESHVVKGDPYEIRLYLPDNYKIINDSDNTLRLLWTEIAKHIWKCAVVPEISGAIRWTARCVKTVND